MIVRWRSTFVVASSSHVSSERCQPQRLSATSAVIVYEESSERAMWELASDFVVLGATLALFFALGWYFFHRFLLKDYEAPSRVPSVLFSTSLAISCVMFELIIFEIIDTLDDRCAALTALPPLPRLGSRLSTSALDSVALSIPLVSFLDIEHVGHDSSRGRWRCSPC